MAEIKLFLVIGRVGEYDAADSWNVRAFDVEQLAKDFAEKCEREVRAAATAWRSERRAWKERPINEQDAEVSRRDAALPDQHISVDTFDAKDVAYYVEPLHASLSSHQQNFTGEKS